MYGRIEDFNLRIVLIAFIFVSEFTVLIRGDQNDLHVTYLSRHYTPDDTKDALYNLRRMPSVCRNVDIHKGQYMHGWSDNLRKKAN